MWSYGLAWLFLLISIFSVSRSTESSEEEEELLDRKSKSVYFTRYGDKCTNECNFHGENYFWCNTEGSKAGWDYCSPHDMKTKGNKTCKEKCSKNGEKYYWCYRESGGWDYCSPAPTVDLSDLQDSGLPMECVNGKSEGAPMWLKGPGHPIEITSPNYPSSFNYTHLECTWKVNAEFGSKVKVTVIETSVDSGCFENSLAVYDDSPMKDESILKFPGLSAKCGENTFPSVTHPIIGNGAVTVKFKSNHNDGSVKFKLILEATEPECPSKMIDPVDHCPMGPCCTGVDCCVLHLDKNAIEINSPNYPHDSGHNKQCTYKLVAAEGSRVSLNFLDMDLRKDHLHTCLNDHVQVIDPVSSGSRFIAKEGTTFCGQHLPNFPGPSILVSAENTLYVKYKTDTTKIRRGRGFKASVAAINPICSSMSYSHVYGDHQCEHTCSPSLLKPTDVTTAKPPCFDGKSPLTLTIINNATGLPISGATVNITSTSSGPQSVMSEKTKLAGLEGVVSNVILENGNYKVSVTAEGFLDQTVDILVDCDPNLCDQCKPSEIIKLTKVEGDVEDIRLCNAKIGLKVKDETSEKAIKGAFVEIAMKLEDETLTTIANVSTNRRGKIKVPISNNGDYVLTVSKETYNTSVLEATMACDPSDCSECNTFLHATLNRPFCNGDNTPKMKIHVRAANEDSIAGATVNVFMIGETKKTIKENVQTDGNGIVEIDIPSNGIYRVSVENNGYNPMESDTEVVCDLEDCSACSPIAIFYMEKIPMTLNDKFGVPCTEEVTNFSINIFDNLTHSVLTTARANISVLLEEEIHMVAENASPENDGSISIPISLMGPYTVSVASDGYYPVSKKVNVSCTTETCNDCNTNIEIPIEQNFCKETNFQIVVSDSITESKIPGAKVGITMTGHDHNVSLTENAMSNLHGVVTIPITGRADYLVKISRDGYNEYQGTSSIACQLNNCAACKPTLKVDLTQPFTCPNQVTVDITVIDKKINRPIEGAIVKLVLTHSLTGPSSIDIGGDLKTDSDGKVKPPINIDGRYRVSVESSQYLAKSIEVEMNCSASCENPMANIELEPIPAPFCPDRTMEITVSDFQTNVTISSAIINVAFDEIYQGELIRTPFASDQTTDINGKLTIPVNANGNFTVSVVKALGYDEGEGVVSVVCSVHDCEACNPKLKISLDQPRCPSTVIPITITDSLVHQAVPNAKVTLYLTNSLSGPSLIPIDTPQMTDEEGRVTFPAKMNGVYAARIEKEGYTTNERNASVECNIQNCEACAPMVNILLQQEFCEDVNMIIVIRDSLTNEGVEGANVTMTMAGYHEPLHIGSALVNQTGYVTIPIEGNGFYTITVTKPDFITMTKTMQVNTTLGQCEILAPVEIFPLSPELPCPGGARVSLSWNEEPMDLDLYSYRVTINDTSNSCLTYYCDQKEQCGCTTFDKDNFQGGLNGSETITYCCQDLNTHMIYVDDLSGKGKSLLSSGAQLTITSRDRVIRVKMNPQEASDEHRFWLAGCLSLEQDSFQFTELNDFTSQRPSIEKPLECHNRVSLQRATAIPYGLPTNVAIAVTVRDAVTNMRLEGVPIEISTRSESHSRISDSNGNARIPINHNGKYKVDVDIEDYAAANSEIVVECEEEENCKPEILLSLSPKMAASSIRVILNWDDQPDDLDLFSLEVSKEDNRGSCLTYRDNMHGCTSSSLDHDNSAGGQNGVETITYHDVAVNAKYSHMIFVDDASGHGALLSRSRARITITDGINSLSVEMPEFDESTSAGVRYWFAGCLQIVGETYNFVPQAQFSRERPSEKDKLFCDKLFRTAVPNSGLNDQAEPFCDDTHLKVKVHNAVDNRPVANASIDVHHISGDSQQLVAERITTTEDGTVAPPIKRNGEYMISVKAEGYVRDAEFINVACNMASCGECHPQRLFSLSPALARGNARIIMNWDEKPTDLDIYTFQVDMKNRTQTCLTKYSNKNGCEGVTLDKDNARGGNNGAETITFDQIEVNSHFVYMVYVNDYSRNPELFARSNVHLTITDGIDISKTYMNVANFNNERYWMAGCMRFVNGKFDFVASNAFLNSAPKDKVPLHCIDLFGLNVDPLSCFEENTDYPGNDMNNGNRNKQDSAVECRESCLRSDSCVGFTWNKLTQDCWLKPTMVQRKRVNTEVISGRAVCDDPTAPYPEPEPSRPWWQISFGRK